MSNSTTNNFLPELVARKRRREKRKNARKRVISSGWKADTLNTFSLIGASLICLAHFEHLQTEADYKLVEFGHFSLTGQLVREIILHGHWISMALLVVHVIAIKLSKTRFTFPSLLGLFAWPINALLHFEQINNHDYLISRLAFSAFTVIIMTAIIFLPKKLKRRKRPNTFFSAFSIASTTPMSEQSQLDLSQSSFGNRTIDFNDNESMFSNGFIRNGIHNENALNGFSAAYNMRKRTSSSRDTMSLRSGKTFASGKSVGSAKSIVSGSTLPTQSMSNKSNNWREKRRESTPMREVRELIDDLLINTTDDDDSSDETPITTLEPNTNKQTTPRMLSTGAVSPGRRNIHQGPFSSLTFNPAVYKKANTPNSKAGASSAIYAPKFVNGNPKTISYGGSSCSSLTSTLVSSPFGGISSKL